MHVKKKLLRYDMTLWLKDVYIVENNHEEKIPLVEVNDLSKWFPVKSGTIFTKNNQYLKAVNSISFSVNKEETIAIVGESGSGKSTLARLILALHTPTSGVISFKGKNIFAFNAKELKQFRKEAQLIFQDPVSSLNSRYKIRKILSEPLKLHFSLTRDALEERINDLLISVGLDPSTHPDCYPHELSGGQRQRIGIARAISLNPQLIIADEPVASLDVSIKGQILNLLKRIAKQERLTYLFITHDLAIVRSIANRVIVMYLGEIVEDSPVNKLFDEPLHPYSKALLSATPVPNPFYKREKIILKGEIPSPINRPKGCVFQTRCISAIPECQNLKPALKICGDRLIACHLVNPT